MFECVRKNGKKKQLKKACFHNFQARLEKQKNEHVTGECPGSLTNTSRGCLGEGDCDERALELGPIELSSAHHSRVRGLKGDVGCLLSLINAHRLS